MLFYFILFLRGGETFLLTHSDSLEASGLLSEKRDGKYNLCYWFEMPSNTPQESSFIVRNQAEMQYNLLPEFASIGICFRHYYTNFGNNKHLGTCLWRNENSRGDYTWQIFSTISQHVTNIGSGMLEIGLKKGSRIGICSANRSEWVLADYETHCQEMATIPLHDTLSKNAIEYIVNHASVKCIYCSKETLEEALKARKVCVSLKYIILMDDQVPDHVFVKQNNKQSGRYRHIFSQKIQDNFGGNVKAAVSGSRSAPLSSTTANFIKICFSDVLVQGYGHNRNILRSVEMKLMDVGDMNYFSNDKPNPHGEIWLYCALLFQGYYKMIDKTNEVLTKDGWFATGDIGEWCDNGILKIIDGKKNTFILIHKKEIIDHLVVVVRTASHSHSQRGRRSNNNDLRRVSNS